MLAEKGLNLFLDSLLSAAQPCCQLEPGTDQIPGTRGEKDWTTATKNRDSEHY
jgi:hypothetical protein